MSFQFKYINQIKKYLELELGLNENKINKIITEIENIENNKVKKKNICCYCEEETRHLEKCVHCKEKICSACYEICNICRNIFCYNCILDGGYCVNSCNK